MSTNFPASQDNLPDPTPSTATNDPTVGHAELHVAENDAIEAIEGVLLNGTSYPLALSKRTDQPGGDVSGTLAGPLTVAKIQGTPVSSTAPTTNQILSFDGTRWIPKTTAETATPASTVSGPDAFGAAHVVGTSNNYAREDHDHGLPAAPADLPLAGGTMSGAIAMGSNKITGLANGTASTDAAAFGQIPTALPPNGTAGGDLSGTYPNPTVAKVNGVAAASIALVQENVNTVGTSGSAQTIPDVTSDTINYITLTANCTFTFPTAAAGKSFLLGLLQDATGSRTVTWPGTVKWSGGTAPTLTTTASKLDVFSFVCLDGTNWVGVTAGLNF